MATTSFSLGPYWDDFIKQQVGEGRFGSASEVVRHALRGLEVETKKFAALKAELQIGLDQLATGEYVEDFDADDTIARAKERAKRTAAE